MAVVGQQLTAPESGWKRYDDKNPCFKYQGQWADYVYSSHYQGSHKATSIQNDKVSFKFYGTKLRIIGYRSSEYSTSIEIKIDGIAYIYSQQGASQFQTILFEATGLMLDQHLVEIKKLDASGTNAYIGLDAIDIDSTGRLLHPDEVTSIYDLSVGKRIRCHYTAGSNQFGTFSDLGKETSDFIPSASTATPNGDFYWICVGYDYLERLKLVADRNIQIGISWDTLNAAGIVTGKEIYFTEVPSAKFNIRLLTGGISSTDKDNEWDKIIVESNLGGTITPGDNNVWNWNGVWSLTSTTRTEIGATARVVRGQAFVANYSHVYTPDTSSTSGPVGFRPVLLSSLPSFEIESKELIPSTVWYTDTGTITLSASITHLNNIQIQYRILVNNNQVYPTEGYTSLQPTPTTIVVTFDKTLLTERENLIELQVQDEYGNKTSWDYTIIKENIDTVTAERRFEFPGEWNQEDNSKISIELGGGLKLVEGVLNQDYYVTTTNLNHIITLGRSNIINVVVDGSDDIIENVNFIEDMTTPTPLGAGYVSEYDLRLNRFTDINTIAVIIK
ncbi:hypothetical protein E308F_30670 [Moorella sp. E308F]|uniref:hypothetical protein n=1 Tax=Moorella sp. E308F TaxID=2572682 RepID=UPI0010FFBF81|nr:hypothetical protein [Moorella sp. E308F]GEA16821.1 hypothetical protein E308F_30670 [Moorella sp. E308F]